MVRKIYELCRTVLALLLLATLAGCAAGGAGGGGPGKRHQPSATEYDLSTAQDQVADFADNYITAVADLYAQILRDQGTNLDVRREALRAWLVTTRAVLINATDHNPVYGMVNMVILVRVQRSSYAEPWFEQTFGAPAAAAARTLMAEQDQHISELAGQYLTPAQTEELRAAIDAWLARQPALRAGALVRLQDLEVARGPEQVTKTPPGSIFALAFVDPFASLAPAVREAYRSRLAARRMFHFAQRMPSVLRIEAQLLGLDLLAEPQVAGALEDLTKLNTNITDFLAISRRVSDDLARFPANLRAEREKAIEQVSDTLTVQRDAAIKQIAEATARERTAAIEQLTSSVDRVGRDLVDQVAQAAARERVAALREAGSTVGTQQRIAWADVDAASKTFVTRLVVGLCLAALIIAVGVALVMLGYRWTAGRLFPTAGAPGPISPPRAEHG